MRRAAPPPGAGPPILDLRPMTAATMLNGKNSGRGSPAPAEALGGVGGPLAVGRRRPPLRPGVRWSGHEEEIDVKPLICPRCKSEYPTDHLARKVRPENCSSMKTW